MDKVVPFKKNVLVILPNGKITARSGRRFKNYTKKQMIEKMLNLLKRGEL